MTGWNRTQDVIHIFQRERWRGSCEFAMLSLCTDSATELATICFIVEIFTCRYSRMMKSSNSALVPASAYLSTCPRREFENIVGIYFLFFAAGREFHIYEESHAPGHGDVICRTTASVASGIECVHVHKRHIFISVVIISLVICCAIFCSTGCEPNWGTLFSLSSIAIFKQIETF